MLLFALQSIVSSSFFVDGHSMHTLRLSIQIHFSFDMLSGIFGIVTIMLGVFLFARRLAIRQFVKIMEEDAEETEGIFD